MRTRRAASDQAGGERPGLTAGAAPGASATVPDAAGEAGMATAGPASTAAAGALQVREVREVETASRVPAATGGANGSPAVPTGAGPSCRRLLLALAAVVYVPLLLTQPGWVSADTKTYLYLDPSRLLSRAWSMWDPSFAAGTVTHQSIGFLWPMGPFYWLAETAGLPDWVAQRLWWGTILFLAGAGVAFLLRTLGWRVPGPGVTAAVFVYALTPYSLSLVARLSGILLPFAGLPWLLALTIRALRHRGWRHPALFALAVATFGSVNATALLLVLLAPALWLAWSVVAPGALLPPAGHTGAGPGAGPGAGAGIGAGAGVGAGGPGANGRSRPPGWPGGRGAALRRVAVTAAKLGVLTLPVSAWWIAGLSVQATHGIEIIRYTETAEVVASTSTGHEVLRGLGYWFFYGTDRLGPWIEPSIHYTQWLPVIALSYLVPLLGLAGGAVARWRDRAFFVALLLAGTALAVGAFPRDRNPPFGRLVQAFQTSDVGLALRSLPRAVPLVVLGLAVLLGAGVTSVARRWPAGGRRAGIGVAVVAVLALPALWLGELVPGNLRRPEDVPRYWEAAARALDRRGDARGDAGGDAAGGTRVLAVPGSDFASYRWGNTVDPILPGLMDRPSLQRELAPYGSPPTVNLLNAFDLTLQERTADPDALAPIARLLRAGDVLLISDWQYERYNTPRPRNLWDLVAGAPGLGEPQAFGPGEPNLTVEDVQLDDELLLLTDPRIPHPPELATFPVPGTAPIVATQPTTHPLLVAGDGAGLVDAAGAGLIDGRELIRYSASLDDREVADALDQGAALLLTDSNRRRGERWSNLRHNRGYTETATSEPLATDLTDNRMELFPEAGTDTMTVVERRAPAGRGDGGTGSSGDDAGRSVTVEAEATSYGNSISFTAAERPMLAVDGDPETAWRTAGFADARGERLELRLSAPATTDHVRLLQATTAPTTRFVTRARLRFGTADGGGDPDTDPGGDTVDVDLTSLSRSDPGQVVRFPERTFSSLSIEILADSAGDVPRYAGQSSLGFAEVGIEGVRGAQETVRLPTDLLDAAGAASRGNPLAVSLTRQRQDPTDPTRDDEELALDRLLRLPTGRSFSLAGTARLSARADAHLVDELLGRPRDGPVPWVRARGDVAGSVATPAAAFDGDPATAWTTPRARPRHSWVEVVLPEPATVDRLPLTVVADGLHSVPTEVELWVDGSPVGRVAVPEVRDGDRQNATRRVELDVPEVTGSRFRLRLTRVRAVRTNDWVSDRPVPQPAAIAEIGLPGPHVPALPERFDSGCRDDLLQIDGEPVPVRVTGSMADALAARPLTVALCRPDGGADPAGAGAAPTVDLAAGQHRLEARPGRATAIDLDQLVLRSSACGTASTSDGPLVAEARATTRAGDGGRDADPPLDDGGRADPRTSCRAGDGAGATGGPQAGRDPLTGGSSGADRVDGGAGPSGQAPGAATRQPRIQVVGEDHDRLRLRVSGARPGTPFWLVLGQSHNPGWRATVAGETLAAPELVDGFANGWLVTPGRASFEVDLEFAPQRRVDLALWISAASAAGCLLLALRRPRPLPSVTGRGSPGVPGPARRPDAATAPAPFSGLDAFRYTGALPRRRAAWLTGLVAGVLAWVLAGPGVGLVVGIAAGIATRRETARRLLVLASPAAVAAITAYVLYIQLRHSPQASFDWPFELRRVHPLGWLAALLLAADVLVARTWRRSRR